MLIRHLYTEISGYVNIKVEGFFVERFINMCLAQDIFLWNIKYENNALVKLKIFFFFYNDIKEMVVLLSFLFLLYFLFSLLFFLSF